MTRFISIRLQLTFWYIALLAVTVFGFSFFLYYEQQEILSNQIDAGIQVAASQLLVDVDDSVNPPILRPMSRGAATHILQSSFASRLVTVDGEVVADVGNFPALSFTTANTGFQTISIDNTPWRIYSQQVETDDQQYDVWLQVGQSLNVIQDTQQTLFRLIMITLPIVLILTALSGTFMASRALNPVDTITRTVQDIHATDMSKRVIYHGPNDELGRLTQTLNSMLERLQSAFDAERRFTADASHELRTPLTAIKGHIGVTLTRQRDPHEYEQTLHQIQTETERLIRLTNDLLFLARLDASPLHWQTEIINLSNLLDAVLDQMRILATEKRIGITSAIPDDIMVIGMTDQLIRLFLNLIDNAIKYTLADGTIHVLLVVDQQLMARVEISDNGIGIAPQHLPHLFERFYRAGRDQHSHHGAGLGLPVAYQITRTHGGTIDIQSRLDHGTIVTVMLPLADTTQK